MNNSATATAAEYSLAFMHKLWPKLDGVVVLGFRVLFILLETDFSRTRCDVKTLIVNGLAVFTATDTLRILKKSICNA